MANQLTITANNETKTIDAANVGQHLDIQGVQAAGLCQYWATAKTALQLLLGSANAFLKIAISLVIAAGDLACPGN